MRGWGRQRLVPTHAAASAPEVFSVCLRPPQMMGVTERALAAHHALHDRQAGELVALRGRLRGAVAVAPAMTLSERALLADRVCDMPPRIEGKMAALLDRLRDELLARGISWFPAFFPGDDDFWTADRGVGINVPWYLMNDALWDLVNPRTAAWTDDDLMRVLRHEVGHALGYAFELWRRPGWARSFGDFSEPYLESYDADPTSEEYVRNLHLSIAADCPHYAQKHPDEDWAETFAVWLDPLSDWRRVYAVWPAAIAKLEEVDSMLASIRCAPETAVVTAVGRATPWGSLQQTVGAYLGEPAAGAAEERAPLLQREAYLAAECTLHELFFEQASVARLPYWSPAGRLLGAVNAAFGSFEDWKADLRAAARGAGGWVLATWDAPSRRIRTSVVEGAAGAPPGAAVLLALDMREHAYALDYGLRKDRHVAALLAEGAIDWTVVMRRLDRAEPPPVITVSVRGALMGDPALDEE